MEEGAGLEEEAKKESTEFLFLESEQGRKEIFEITRRLFEYIEQNNIKNVVFVDRAARPAYIALREYWKQLHPQENPPFKIYFANPKGFMTEDFLKRKHPQYNKPLAEVYDDKAALAARVEKSSDLEEDIAEARTSGEIEEDFKRSYRELIERRNEGTIIFDTCIHSGMSLQNIVEVLKKNGFTSLKIGVVDEHKSLRRVKPDFVAIPQRAYFACTPFDTDTLIGKTYTSVHSEPSGYTRTGTEVFYNKEKMKRGIMLREQIKRVIAEFFKK